MFGGVQGLANRLAQAIQLFAGKVERGLMDTIVACNHDGEERFGRHWR
jgi:hypothetical protein